MGDVKYSYFEIQNEEAEAGHHYWLLLGRRESDEKVL